jgi:dihydroxyacid dehydratase/phosphogluconate dehydratase
VGGLPFEIRTAAPSDFITGAGARGAYILSARDLIPNDIEVEVEGAQLDGMVCLASCDKTVPGQLMAAARLNIPALVVACAFFPLSWDLSENRRHSFPEADQEALAQIKGPLSVEVHLACPSPYI